MRRRLALAGIIILIGVASSMTLIGISCDQANTTVINTTSSLDDFVGDASTEDAIVRAAESDTDDAIGLWGSARLNIANFRYNCAGDACDLTRVTVETIPAPWLSCSFLDDEVPHIQYVFDLETDTVNVTTDSLEGSAPDRVWADRVSGVDEILQEAQRLIEVDTYALSLTWIGEWTGQVILDEANAERLDFGE